MLSDDKKEQVIMQYLGSYDLDVAMTMIDLTDDERKELLKDSDFMFRIKYQDARIREKIVGKMIDSLDSSNGQLAHKAAIDLGSILYKSKFSKKEEEKPFIVPDVINLVGA